MDPYLYKNSAVLKNKLGTRDQKLLDNAEADYVSLRLRELAETPLSGDYGMAHFLSMHKYIFQDIYDWAGKTRTVNMEKYEPVLGGLSIEYSDIKNIERDLESALLEASQLDWNADPKILAKELSKYIADIWKVHAFREGNTRTVITFFCQLVDEKYKKANRKIFEDDAAYVRTALVAYCATFKNSEDYSKKEYLEKIVEDALS